MAQNTSYNLAIPFVLGCIFPRELNPSDCALNLLYNSHLGVSFIKWDFLHLSCIGFPLFWVHIFIFIGLFSYFDRVHLPGASSKRCMGGKFCDLACPQCLNLPSDLIKYCVGYRILHGKLLFFRISKF